MSKLYIDIETRSRVNLKKTGVYRYVRCPDFRILMASWAIDDGPVTTALSAQEISAIPFEDASIIKVAHNAQFERVCFSAFLDMPDGTYLPPQEWRDTQALAGEHGWPQSLEMLGPAISGEVKDEAGTRLINLFSKPVSSGKRKGLWNGPDTHPMEWLDFIAYCEQDVETLRAIDQVLGDWPTPMEKLIFEADQAINDRGIAIDVELALRAVAAGQENAAEQLARVRELSGIENPNSIPQMGAWLRRVGIKAPNLRAETVEKLLEGDLRADHREVLELRQELALAAPKKFDAALGAVLPDGRLRGTLKFFGAHTGRWAGRGTQIQNLPRHTFKTDEETELAVWELMSGFGASSDTLKRLVRPMFLVDGCVIDYSSIEARVLAGLAGEEWALEAFRQGRDIYVETAERMSTPDRPLDRAQGKVAVLALGYNGGTNSLRAMGADGTEDELQVLVTQWRKANRRITTLWQKLGDAFAEEASAGPMLRTTESYDKLGRAVHLWLPSGRAITYHGVKWERYRVRDERTGRMLAKEGWRYADPKNPFNPNQRIGTYGGRLAENVTQAVARDIMGEALVRLEQAGHRVIGHVHDEILVEGSHDVDEIKKIMTEVPSWAEGFPIDGEGFTTYRYKKG